VHVYIIRVDLDIDSDNNNGKNPPDRSALEDLLEDFTPKTVRDGFHDLDRDLIPDFADGYNRDGADPKDDINAGMHFVPVVFEISDNIDLNLATFSIQYSGSDPFAVIRHGSGTDAEPYYYTTDG